MNSSNIELVLDTFTWDLDSISSTQSINRDSCKEFSSHLFSNVPQDLKPPPSPVSLQSEAVKMAEMHHRSSPATLENANGAPPDIVSMSPGQDTLSSAQPLQHRLHFDSLHMRGGWMLSSHHPTHSTSGKQRNSQQLTSQRSSPFTDSLMDLTVSSPQTALMMSNTTANQQRMLSFVSGFSSFPTAGCPSPAPVPEMSGLPEHNGNTKQTDRFPASNQESERSDLSSFVSLDPSIYRDTPIVASNTQPVCNSSFDEGSARSTSLVENMTSSMQPSFYAPQYLPYAPMPYVSNMASLATLSSSSGSLWKGNPVPCTSGAVYPPPSRNAYPGKVFSTTNLFVQPLPLWFDDMALEELFGAYGKVTSATVQRDIHTARSSGRGFVRYENHEDAVKGKAALEGKRLSLHPPPENGDVSLTDDALGMPLSIQWANVKHDDALMYKDKHSIKKLFVRNIPVCVALDQLKDLFKQFGKLKDVSLHEDTFAATGVSSFHSPPSSTSNKATDSRKEVVSDVKGIKSEDRSSFKSRRRIAFVTFAEKDSALKAARAIHNTQPFDSCDGVALMVKLALDVVPTNGNSRHNRSRQANPSQTMHARVVATCHRAPSPSGPNLPSNLAFPLCDIQPSPSSHSSRTGTLLSASDVFPGETPLNVTVKDGGRPFMNCAQSPQEAYALWSCNPHGASYSSVAPVPAHTLSESTSAHSFLYPSNGMGPTHGSSEVPPPPAGSFSVLYAPHPVSYQEQQGWDASQQQQVPVPSNAVFVPLPLPIPGNPSGSPSTWSCGVTSSEHGDFAFTPTFQPVTVERLPSNMSANGRAFYPTATINEDAPGCTSVMGQVNGETFSSSVPCPPSHLSFPGLPGAPVGDMDASSVNAFSCPTFVTIPQSQSMKMPYHFPRGHDNYGGSYGRALQRSSHQNSKSSS